MPIQYLISSTLVSFGGSGLGLFVTRRLTELMGGRIEVDSKLGEGSIFRFFIKVGKIPMPPAIEAGAAGEATPMVVEAEGTASKIRNIHPDRKIRVFVVEGEWSSASPSCPFLLTLRLKTT